MKTKTCGTERKEKAVITTGPLTSSLFRAHTIGTFALQPPKSSSTDLQSDTKDDTINKRVSTQQWRKRNNEQTLTALVVLPYSKKFNEAKT